MQVVIPALIAGAGVAAASSQVAAGKMRNIEYKEQAQQEQDAARDREIDRRRRLVSALASQNAEAGALGATTGVGSGAAIALTDARRANYESLADRATTNRRSLMLRTAGKFARRQGNAAAVATLLDTGTDVANAWPGKDD